MFKTIIMKTNNNYDSTGIGWHLPIARQPIESQIVFSTADKEPPLYWKFMGGWLFRSLSFLSKAKRNDKTASHMFLFVFISFLLYGIIQLLHNVGQGFKMNWFDAYRIHSRLFAFLSRQFIHHASQSNHSHQGIDFQNGDGGIIPIQRLHHNVHPNNVNVGVFLDQLNGFCSILRIQYFDGLVGNLEIFVNDISMFPYPPPLFFLFFESSTPHYFMVKNEHQKQIKSTINNQLFSRYNKSHFLSICGCFGILAICPYI
jgi:hypothetical protein